MHLQTEDAIIGGGRHLADMNGAPDRDPLTLRPPLLRHELIEHQARCNCPGRRLEHHQGAVAFTLGRRHDAPMLVGGLRHQLGHPRQGLHAIVASTHKYASGSLNVGEQQRNVRPGHTATIPRLQGALHRPQTAFV